MFSPNPLPSCCWHIAHTCFLSICFHFSRFILLTLPCILCFIPRNCSSLTYFPKQHLIGIPYTPIYIVSPYWHKLRGLWVLFPLSFLIDIFLRYHFLGAALIYCHHLPGHPVDVLEFILCPSDHSITISQKGYSPCVYSLDFSPIQFRIHYPLQCSHSLAPKVWLKVWWAW